MFDLISAKKYAIEKTRMNGAVFGDRLPTHTTNGRFDFSGNGSWVGGFWTGMNYLCYELTKEEAFLKAARASGHRFSKRLYENPETLDHDIGFLYSLSSVADYKITGSLSARKMALDAADVLAARYHVNGKFIRAWNIWADMGQFGQENAGRIIADCMYNLPLLFWAYQETAERTYYDIAISHAETTMKYLVRDDYTAYHTFVFDPVTGAPKYGQTFQGYSDGSCWARGQAWLIGGFSYAYNYTNDERFLKTAIHCAKVYLDKLEADLMPVWDLSLKGNCSEPRDTAAASVAATGLIELSKLCENEEKEYFFNMAVGILAQLFDNYTTRGLADQEGILLHGTIHKPQNFGVDCSIIYGDYYFIEAVYKIIKNKSAFF